MILCRGLWEWVFQKIEIAAGHYQFFRTDHRRAGQWLSPLCGEVGLSGRDAGWAPHPSSEMRRSAQ